MKPSTTLLVLVALLSTLLASCSPSQGARATATQQASGSQEVQVTIEGFAYHPADLTIAVGTTVTWTNKDAAPHTSTSDDALWDSGRLSQGGSYAHTFGEPGTFTYHCLVHPSIKGTITVTQ